MRKIKLVILISLITVGISCGIYGQVYPFGTNPTEIADGGYLKDTNHEIDPYIGEWVFNDGTTIFKISLYKKTETVNGPNGNYDLDYIVGKYHYEQNNVVVTSTYNLNDPNSDDMPIVSSSLAVTNMGNIKAIIEEIDNQYTQNVFKISLNTNQDELTWTYIEANPFNDLNAVPNAATQLLNNAVLEKQ